MLTYYAHRIRASARRSRLVVVRADGADGRATSDRHAQHPPFRPRRHRCRRRAVQHRRVIDSKQITCGAPSPHGAERRAETISKSMVSLGDFSWLGDFFRAEHVFEKRAEHFFTLRVRAPVQA